MRLPPYRRLMNPWLYRVLVRVGFLHSPSICLESWMRNGYGCPRCRRRGDRR